LLCWRTINYNNRKSYYFSIYGEINLSQSNNSKTTLNDVGGYCILAGLATLFMSWLIMFVSGYWAQFLVPVHLFIAGGIIIYLTSPKEKSQ
jgi:hypothetical protein